jgi:hypothetical protein
MITEPSWQQGCSSNESMIISGGDKSLSLSINFKSKSILISEIRKQVSRNDAEAEMELLLGRGNHWLFSN